MTYAGEAYTAGFFLLAIGIGLLWLATRSPEPRGKFGLRHGLLVMTGVFTALGLFTFVSAFAYTTEYANNATCENIILNTTESWNNVTNITTVTYNTADSCQDRGRYELGDNLLVIYVWASFLIVITLGFGLIWLIGKWVSVW